MEYGKTAILFFLFFLLTLTACSEKEQTMLSKNEMALALADFHRLEAILTSDTNLPDSISSIVSLYAEKKILFNHNIPDSAFYNSYQHYILHEDSLSDVYRQVEILLDDDINKLSKGKF